LIGNDSPKKAVLREAFDVILISLFLNPTVFTLLFFLQPWKDYRYKLEGKFGALTQLEEATPRGVEECVVPLEVIYTIFLSSVVFYYYYYSSLLSRTYLYRKNIIRTGTKSGKKVNSSLLNFLFFISFFLHHSITESLRTSLKRLKAVKKIDSMNRYPPLLIALSGAVMKTKLDQRTVEQLRK
jgi:hypothetical protein